MLEKPDLPDEKIIACLQAEYGLRSVEVAFLPLGADMNTAVYRITTPDETAYFLKLRRGSFNETAVTLPKFLHDQGIPQIIAPLTTQTGQLWANLDAFAVILYPFIDGRNGYEIDLTDRHWIEFGEAMKRIHTAVLPPILSKQIQQETYSPQGRETVKSFLNRVEIEAFAEPVAKELAAFLQTKRAEILDLVGRADYLAQTMNAQPLPFIVCHSDIHAGNILINGNGAFYIVDWDDPILAPKERDLMYIGGGQGFSGHTAQEEEALFYQGYGQTPINAIALAYYRYERIIQDIAAFCEQLLLTNEGGEDREQALHYLKSNFLPNQTIEIAYRSDKTGDHIHEQYKSLSTNSGRQNQTS